MRPALALAVVACLSIATVAMAWRLTATIPTHNAVSKYDCSPRPDTLTDFSRVRIWRQRKSPIAVRLGLLLYTNPDTFAAYWPQVKRDAESEWVANVTSFPATLSDTLSPGWWYYATVVDKSGNESCRSNNIWR